MPPIYTIVLLCSACVAASTSTMSLRKTSFGLSGTSIKIRPKRSPAKVIVHADMVMRFLTNGATKLMTTFEGVTWFEKAGGYKKAISEFSQFQPTNSRSFNKGKGVFGDVGPLKIIVDNVKGNGMMVINDNRTGETKFIIQYLAEH